MLNRLPSKENAKAQYLLLWNLNKELMTECLELDGRGMGKIRKTIALMRLPQTSKLINELADCQVELSRAGIKSIPTDYFTDSETAPIIDEMSKSLSFWHGQIGISGEIAVALRTMSEVALRRTRIKPIHNKLFAGNTL